MTDTQEFWQPDPKVIQPELKAVCMSESREIGDVSAHWSLELAHIPTRRTSGKSWQTGLIEQSCGFSCSQSGFHHFGMMGAIGSL
jgi:hypothetical protein